MMSKRVRAAALAVTGLLVATGGACAQGGGAPVAVADVWPRAFPLPNPTLLMYLPQVESWNGNVLNYRAAVGVKATGSDQEVRGVIRATARTQVDREGFRGTCSSGGRASHSGEERGWGGQSGGGGGRRR